MALAVALAVAPLGFGSGAPAQEAEWFGRIVAQSDLTAIVGARINVEPVPEGGLMADVEPVAQLPADAVRTTSGVEGRFAIDASPGQRLRVSAPGFLDGFVLLHENRDHDLGRLVLRHEMSFSGRVLVDGRPEAGVAVIVPADHGFGDKLEATTSRRTITRGDGAFHIDALRPEQTRELLIVRDELAFPVDFGHPLYPFDPRHYDLGDVELPPIVQLTGEARAPDGSPANDALVWVLRSLDGALRLPDPDNDDDAEIGLRQPLSAVGGDGRFELAVIEGRYAVAAFSPGHGQAIVEIDVSSSAQDVPLRIDLPGAASYRGRVVDSEGVPIGGAGVIVPTDRPAPTTTFAGEPLRFTADADGCFVANGLPRDETGYLAVESPGFVLQRFRIEEVAESPGEVDCEDARMHTLQPAGTLSGVVIDEQGVPVPGAQLTFRRAQQVGGYLTPGREPATTDVEGRFHAAELLFGDYSVDVRAPGRLTTTIENVALGPLGDGAAPPRDRELEIVVDSIADRIHLEVLVLDSRGAPAPEAGVNADFNGDGMVARVPSPEPAFTGADGRVVFAETAAGLYSIIASADGRRDYSGWQGPYRMEASDAPAIVEMRSRASFVSLTGRLVDVEGNGIARAIVHADGSPRRDDTARTLTEADGSFRFDNLIPGRWALKAEVDRDLEVIHRELLEVDGVGEPPDVVIRVPRLGRISGRVDNLRPGELDGLWVSASTSEDYGDRVSQSTSSRVEAASDGTFVLPNLIPGEWHVYARTAGDRDASITVQVPEGAAVADVNIPLPLGLTLSGNVTWRDGTDPDDLGAWLRLSGYESGASREVSVGADGLFEVRDLPPGLYDVMVSGSGLRAPFFLPVEVRQDTQIEIPMRGASVAGAVIDSVTGDPIPGVGIRTDPIPQRTFDMHDQFRDTDRNGRFEAGPFPAGPWSFEFTAPGYGKRAPVIEIGDEDVDDYVIALDPTPGLSVVFTTPDGSKPSIISLGWRDLEIGEGTQWSVFPESRDTMEFLIPPIRLTRGLLQASGEGLAARVVITNTGEPVTVALEMAGRLRVTLQPPTEPTANRPVARIFDSAGLPVTTIDGEPDRRFNRRREGEFYLNVTMPPGVYRMELETHDGRQFVETFEIFAREVTELSF